MGVEKHLQSGERVLTSWGEFYATDRRLVRYTEDPTAPTPVESLTYEEITGIRLGVRSRFPLLLGGLGVALIGLLVPPRPPVLDKVALALVLAGAAVVLYGFFTRKTFLEFRSPRLSKTDQARWRLEDTRSEGARALARTVHEHVQRLRKERQKKAP
jgi:hypothetical protein